MKAILNRRTIIIFSTALLLAIISIVSVNLLGNSGPVTGVANVLTTPVRVLASLVARPFSDIFAAMYEYEQAMTRIDELTSQIAVMERNFRESQELFDENARLRRMVGLQERHAGYTYEMASFSGWGGDNWTSTFIINRGSSNSNIAQGMPVITEFGYLLGQVSDVGPTQSIVTTIIDTRFSAAAHIGRGDTGYDFEGERPAVATGDFSHMASGMLLLDQIDDRLNVRRGDFVVTAGTAGVFPPGLIIGEIQDVNRHASGIGRFATVSPMVSLDSINVVFFITDFEAPE